jgi:hypothetical protein
MASFSSSLVLTADVTVVAGKRRGDIILGFDLDGGSQRGFGRCGCVHWALVKSGTDQSWP